MSSFSRFFRRISRAVTSAWDKIRKAAMTILTFMFPTIVGSTLLVTDVAVPALDKLASHLWKFLQGISSWLMLLFFNFQLAFSIGLAVLSPGAFRDLVDLIASALKYIINAVGDVLTTLVSVGVKALSPITTPLLLGLAAVVILSRPASSSTGGSSNGSSSSSS